MFGLAHDQVEHVNYLAGIPARSVSVGETINLSLTFSVQPPIFFACTWPAFFSPGGICHNPSGGGPVPQLQLPSGPTGVSIGVFGKVPSWGTPISWTAFSEQSGTVNVIPQQGPNNNNIPSPFAFQAGTCLVADLCDVQLTLVNPASAGQQNATVEIPTATPGANAVDGGPILFTVVQLLVTSIAPNTGPSVGGTPVVIAGSGFAGATDVKFGSIDVLPCSTGILPCFTVNSDGTQIKLTSPPGPVGAATVTIFAADGAPTSTTFAYTAGAPAVLLTTVSASVSPTSYSGQCPKLFTFTGTLSLSGPGTITYKWDRSDGAQAPVESATFAGPGTKTVTDTWTLSPASYSGWEQLDVLSPSPMLSNKAPFTLACD